MYQYKTLAISKYKHLTLLNEFYDNGWEFVNATTLTTTDGDAHVSQAYFTIKKDLDE